MVPRSLREQLVKARDQLFPRKVCAKKKRYATEQHAKSVIKARLASGRDLPEHLTCYRCPDPVCGGWHLTKKEQAK